MSCAWTAAAVKRSSRSAFGADANLRDEFFAMQKNGAIIKSVTSISFYNVAPAGHTRNQLDEMRFSPCT
jgi:hypothetical protein